jgi:thiaminase
MRPVDRFFLVNSQRFISSVFNDEFVNRIGSNRLYLLSFRSVVEQKYKIEELALKNPQ